MKVRIELGLAMSPDEARAWLDQRVVSPSTALTSRTPQPYGEIRDDSIWLGVTAPRRRRMFQRLFRGHLEFDGNTTCLVGKAFLPPNGLIRLGVLLLGSSVALLTGLVALDPVLASFGAVLLVVAAVTSLVSQHRTRKELELLEALLRRPDESTALAEADDDR